MRCGTTLRVFGKAFDARAFAKRHKMKTQHLWNRGESPVPALPPLDNGGFMLRVSDAVDTFEQMEDAARFLRRHRAKLVALGDIDKVEEVWLEVTFPMHGAKRVTAFMVPRLVVGLAAELGIKLVIIAVPRDMARLKR